MAKLAGISGERPWLPSVERAIGLLGNEAVILYCENEADPIWSYPHIGRLLRYCCGVKFAGQV